ncbi:MAG: ROK family glucokinase [Lachnospiraceae bacterium]|jgi:glucokinase|nr:ROK family glucokinase [Lachnospiraceae bacterium]
MADYAFGIDVGGTTVKCGLFSTKGELLDSWEIPTRKEDGGKYILGDIAEAIRKKCTEKELKKEDVLGVGIGVPGPVLEDGIVNNCVNLGWGVVDVKENLSKLLDDIPVEVGNDANVAALGEQWKGGGRGYKNVVLVTLGTGVGGGIIINGKIIPGSHGAGGEIGHIQVEKNETIPCNCGKKGCLEQYASATGVVRMAKRYLAKTKKATVLRDDETLSAKSIFDAAKANDAAAMEVVEQFGDRLGTALAAINCVVDPEVVVIGGGVSKAGQIILDVVQKYYIPAAFNACRNCLFKLAELGNEAGMYGAVRMVLTK